MVKWKDKKKERGRVSKNQRDWEERIKGLFDQGNSAV